MLFIDGENDSKTGNDKEKKGADEADDIPARKEKDCLTEHEKKMITDLTMINKNNKPEYGVVTTIIIIILRIIIIISFS